MPISQLLGVQMPNTVIQSTGYGEVDPTNSILSLDSIRRMKEVKSCRVKDSHVTVHCYAVVIPVDISSRGGRLSSGITDCLLMNDMGILDESGDARAVSHALELTLVLAMPRLLATMSGSMSTTMQYLPSDRTTGLSKVIAVRAVVYFRSFATEHTYAAVFAQKKPSKSDITGAVVDALRCLVVTIHDAFMLYRALDVLITGSGIGENSFIQRMDPIAFGYLRSDEYRVPVVNQLHRLFHPGQNTVALPFVVSTNRAAGQFPSYYDGASLECGAQVKFYGYAEVGSVVLYKGIRQCKPMYAAFGSAALANAYAPLVPTNGEHDNVQHRFTEKYVLDDAALERDLNYNTSCDKLRVLGVDIHMCADDFFFSDSCDGVDFEDHNKDYTHGVMCSPPLWISRAQEETMVKRRGNTPRGRDDVRTLLQGFAIFEGDDAAVLDGKGAVNMVVWPVINPNHDGVTLLTESHQHRAWGSCDLVMTTMHSTCVDFARGLLRAISTIGPCLESRSSDRDMREHPQEVVVGRLRDHSSRQLFNMATIASTRLSSGRGCDSSNSADISQSLSLLPTGPSHTSDGSSGCMVGADVVSMQFVALHENGLDSQNMSSVDTARVAKFTIDYVANIIRRLYEKDVMIADSYPATAYNTHSHIASVHVDVVRHLSSMRKTGDTNAMTNKFGNSVAEGDISRGAQRRFFASMKPPRHMFPAGFSEPLDCSMNPLSALVSLFTFEACHSFGFYYYPDVAVRSLFSVLSAYPTEPSGMHPFITGDSTTGKSKALSFVQLMFPEGCVIVNDGGSDKSHIMGNEFNFRRGLLENELNAESFLKLQGQDSNGAELSQRDRLLQLETRTHTYRRLAKVTTKTEERFETTAVVTSEQCVHIATTNTNLNCVAPAMLLRVFPTTLYRQKNATGRTTETTRNVDRVPGKNLMVYIMSFFYRHCDLVQAGCLPSTLHESVDGFTQDILDAHVAIHKARGVFRGFRAATGTEKEEVDNSGASARTNRVLMTVMCPMMTVIRLYLTVTCRLQRLFAVLPDFDHAHVHTLVAAYSVSNYADAITAASMGSGIDSEILDASVNPIHSSIVLQAVQCFLTYLHMGAGIKVVTSQRHADKKHGSSFARPVRVAVASSGHKPVHTVTPAQLVGDMLTCKNESTGSLVSQLLALGADHLRRPGMLWLVAAALHFCYTIGTTSVDTAVDDHCAVSMSSRYFPSVRKAPGALSKRDSRQALLLLSSIMYAELVLVLHNKRYTRCLDTCTQALKPCQPAQSVETAALSKLWLMSKDEPYMSVTFNDKGGGSYETHLVTMYNRLPALEDAAGFVFTHADLTKIDVRPLPQSMKLSIVKWIERDAIRGTILESSHHDNHTFPPLAWSHDDNGMVGMDDDDERFVYNRQRVPHAAVQSYSVFHRGKFADSLGMLGAKRVACTHDESIQVLAAAQCVLHKVPEGVFPPIRVLLDGFAVTNNSAIATAVQQVVNQYSNLQGSKARLFSHTEKVGLAAVVDEVMIGIDVKAHDQNALEMYGGVDYVHSNSSPKALAMRFQQFLSSGDQINDQHRIVHSSIDPTGEELCAHHILHPGLADAAMLTISNACVQLHAFICEAGVKTNKTGSAHVHTDHCDEVTHAMTALVRSAMSGNLQSLQEFERTYLCIDTSAVKEYPCNFNDTTTNSVRVPIIKRHSAALNRCVSASATSERLDRLRQLELVNPEVHSNPVAVDAVRCRQMGVSSFVKRQTAVAMINREERRAQSQKATSVPDKPQPMDVSESCEASDGASASEGRVRKRLSKPSRSSNTGTETDEASESASVSDVSRCRPSASNRSPMTASVSTNASADRSTDAETEASAAEFAVPQGPAPRGRRKVASRKRRARACPDSDSDSDDGGVREKRKSKRSKRTRKTTTSKRLRPKRNGKEEKWTEVHQEPPPVLDENLPLTDEDEYEDPVLGKTVIWQPLFEELSISHSAHAEMFTEGGVPATTSDAFSADTNKKHELVCSAVPSIR